MELNKILAALLVAGITAMVAGFITNLIYHPQHLAESAYTVETSGTEATTAPAAAAQTAEPIDALLATASAEAGQKLARTCGACHTFDKGGANRVGPNLWNSFGNKKGHSEGFSYSGAMLEKGGSWTAEDLNQFLFKPKQFIPGTKMTFAGIKKPEDRANIVKWLQTLK